MRTAIPTDLLLRLMNATPEQFAAVEHALGMDADGESKMEVERADSKNRVDSCEHRTDNCVCLDGQQRCPWTGKEIGDGSRELGRKLADLESALKNGFRDLKSEMRRTPHPACGQHFPGAEKVDPPSENEAVRVFALMKSLDAGERVRKAPLHRVFRLLVLEDLSQNAVARKCRCSTALVSMRTKEIERRMGLSVTVLRTLASRVGALASVEDSRARNVYKRGLTDDTGDEPDDD